jgi:hypothetical protein
MVFQTQISELGRPESKVLERFLRFLCMSDAGYSIVGNTKPTASLLIHRDSPGWIVARDGIELLIKYPQLFKGSKIEIAFGQWDGSEDNIWIDVINIRVLEETLRLYPEAFAYYGICFDGTDDFVTRLSEAPTGIHGLLEWPDSLTGLLLGYGLTNSGYFEEYQRIQEDTYETLDSNGDLRWHAHPREGATPAPGFACLEEEIDYLEGVFHIYENGQVTRHKNLVTSPIWITQKEWFAVDVPWLTFICLPNTEETLALTSAYNQEREAIVQILDSPTFFDDLIGMLRVSV